MSLSDWSYRLILAGLIIAGTEHIADTAWNQHVAVAFKKAALDQTQPELFALSAPNGCYVKDESVKKITFVERLDFGMVVPGAARGVTALFDHLGLSSSDPREVTIHDLGDMPIVKPAPCGAGKDKTFLTLNEARDTITDAYNRLAKAAFSLQSASPSAVGDIRIQTVKSQSKTISP